ncbi:hypothetical protein SLE2022_026010 [Rubroshorea leprosula]
MDYSSRPRPTPRVHPTHQFSESDIFDSLSQWPNLIKVKAQAHYQKCIVRKPIFRCLPIDVSVSITAHSQPFLSNNCPIYSPLPSPPTPSKFRNLKPNTLRPPQPQPHPIKASSAASSTTKIEDSRLRNSPSNVKQSPSPWMPWFSST